MEAVYFPAIGLLIGLSTLLTIYIGIQYQLAHQISAGTIAEFVVYINMLTFPVSAIGWVASNIQRAAASQKRLNEFLHTVPTIQNTEKPLQISSIDTIEFKGVGFTYPHTGIQAIKEFNLIIQRGQKIAIIGKTGSGKSTLAQLLLRMFDPQEGSVLINSIPLPLLDSSALRSQISYVPQDVFLFSETVSENILFGSETGKSDMAIAAAETAVIRAEIESLPKGFETAIGERGVTLSGGQKQRISIARALAKESDLLLLDDCLSAVDAKTEYKIAHNLQGYLADRTAIVITHRIFPSFTFDHIIVMDEGRITEQGSHSELLKLNGYYAQLLNTQNS
jgi:ATP-binding cassette subfamily B protein